jgi:hypothetical protein
MLYFLLTRGVTCRQEGQVGDVLSDVTTTNTAKGAQFTCLTSTKVQIMTQKVLNTLALLVQKGKY